MLKLGVKRQEKTIKQFPNPERVKLVPVKPSIPRISFIQWLPVLLAEPPVFGLEILLCVMLRLMADVFPHGFHMYRADTEFPITRLPFEIGIPSVWRFDPAGRGRFDLLDNFRRRVVFGLRKKNVDVVADGIDFDQR